MHSLVKPRKLQGKSGSFTEFTADIDLPSMNFSHMLDDTQPQSCAAFFTGSSFIDDIKAFEDSLQILLWNADTVICDRTDYILPIFR